MSRYADAIRMAASRDFFTNKVEVAATGRLDGRPSLEDWPIKKPSQTAFRGAIKPALFSRLTYFVHL
jgi:hypothetical protein